jgi:hypothetical protein
LSTFTAPGLPPSIGQWRTTAWHMPGRRTSMPNTALPSILAAMSVRGAAVPIRVQSFASFTLTEPGGVAAAAFANSPK